MTPQARKFRASRKERQVEHWSKLSLDEIAILVRTDSIAFEAMDDIFGKVNFRSNPMTVLRFADHKGRAAAAEWVDHEVSGICGHVDNAVEDFG